MSPKLKTALLWFIALALALPGAVGDALSAPVAQAATAAAAGASKAKSSSAKSAKKAGQKSAKKAGQKSAKKAGKKSAKKASAHVAQKGGKKSGKKGGKKSGKKSGKKGGKKARFIEHIVRAGDSLYKIALQYDVKVSDLRTWNKLRNNAIYVGDVVKVKASGPMRSVRRDVHVVKKGESLGSIAKKYKLTVQDLLAANRIRNKRVIHPGQELVVWVEGPEVESKAVGRPQDGRLVDGIQMESGAGYTVRTPAHAWGTWETVHELAKVARRLQKDSRKKAPYILIGDISREGGGHFAPHKSHQNGRDVDISIPIKGDRRPKKFTKATAKNLDLQSTWLLVRALVESKSVDVMFIDRSLQVLLRDYVKRHAARKYRRIADDLFQHPAGRSKAPIIKHEPGHKNHIHVRFKTPADLAS